MKNVTSLLISLCAACCFAQTPTSFYPTSGASGTDFGSAVDISGADIAVSSGSNIMGGPSSEGKVFLFKTADLSQEAIFYAEDATFSDQFGRSISLGNDFLAIGSPYHDLPASDGGAVYIYRKTSGGWQNTYQKITAPDAAADDHFGAFVKISGNLLFVSATDEEAETELPDADNGAVYVFAFDGTSWIFSQKLTVTNTNFGVRHFGAKIATEGSKVLIASNNISSQGYNFMYLYAINGSTLSFENQIGPIGDLEFRIDDFAFSDNRICLAAFGIPGIMNNFNRVDIMTDNGTDWQVSDGFALAPSDQIFNKIEASGSNIFLGSDTYILQMTRKFPLLFYHNDGTSWNLQHTYYGNGAAGQDDFFGSRLALDGNKLVIGAPTEGMTLQSGKAYTLDVTLDTKKFSKNSVSVYPNPTNDLLFIKPASANEITKAELYSASGRLVLSQETNLQSVSLQKLSTGIYMMKLTGISGESESFKIVKN